MIDDVQEDHWVLKLTGLFHVSLPESGLGKVALNEPFPVIMNLLELVELDIVQRFLKFLRFHIVVRKVFYIELLFYL